MLDTNPSLILDIYSCIISINNTAHCKGSVIKVMNRKIRNSEFSVRFCAVMEYHNIKTVGKAKRFLDNLNPNTILHFGTSHTRARYLQRELSAVLSK